jgi:hypothetical protein
LIRVFVLMFSCACAAVPDVTYVDGGDNTCPNAAPLSYADICCGSVPCKGTNCVAACNDCASSCKTTDLCCPNAQGHAVCRPNQQCQ